MSKVRSLLDEEKLEVIGKNMYALGDDEYNEAMRRIEGRIQEGIKIRDGQEAKNFANQKPIIHK